MTATTTDRNSPAAYLQRQGHAPLVASAAVPAGVIVALNADGKVPDGGSSDTAGLIVVGRSEHNADQAEGDDELTYSRGVYGFIMSAALAAVAQANVGRTVYLDDNQTIGLASDTVNMIPVGKLEAIGEDGLGYVSIGLDSGTVASSTNGASVGNVADGNLIGGIPVIHVITVGDVATGDTDEVLADKTEIIGTWCQKTNGAGAANTMQLQTGGGVAISDAMACAVDNAITYAASLDDENTVIAAGGTLRVHHVKAAGTGNGRVFVLGIKRA